MNPKDDILHTGQAPAHRPPDDEPERVGEGELGDGPSASEVNGRDEDRAQTDRSLVEGSPLVDALHSNKKRAADQLTTGSAGDAGRPGKEGIFAKPIPPREDVGGA